MENNKSIIGDNIYIDKDRSFILKEKIVWYDIDENGYINKHLKKEPAVYIFKIVADQTRYYVGSSVNMPSRISKHRSGVVNYNKGKRTSASPMFYDSILKHGWENFKFGVLEYVNITNENTSIKEILLKREQFYLDSINPSLNISRIATSPLGVKRNKMFSINLSKSRRGVKYRPGIINTPKVIMNETILKLSARYAGIKVKIFDKSNNFIKEFTTITETAKYIGVSNRTINNIMKTGISYDDYTYKFEAAIGYPIL